MSDTPNIPALPAPIPSEEGDWMRELVLRQLRMLGDLAEIGLEIAKTIEDRGADRQAAVPALRGDAALAYARVTRSVRQTILLQSKLVEGLNGAAEAGEVLEADAAEGPRHEDEVEQRKARVQRIVERVAKAAYGGDEDLAERDAVEAMEYLDDEDLYGDLMDRPVSELVARICHDLGLEPRWAELVQELWARKEIESGDVGGPLADFARPLPLTGDGTIAKGDGPNDREAVDRAFGRDTG